MLIFSYEWRNSMPFVVVLYVRSTTLNSSRPFSNRSERYSLSCVYDRKTAYIILVFVARLSLVNDKICATISVRDRYFFKSRVKSIVSTYKSDHSLLCHLRYLLMKKDILWTCSVTPILALSRGLHFEPLSTRKPLDPCFC